MSVTGTRNWEESELIGKSVDVKYGENPCSCPVHMLRSWGERCAQGIFYSVLGSLARYNGYLCSRLVQ